MSQTHNNKNNNKKENQQQTTKEPAQLTTSRKPAANKKEKIVVNNIADLKTFLARKKLERAQKMSDIKFQNSSEAQPSQRPQNSQRARQTYSNGEITRTEISLSLADGKPDIAANRDKSQSRDLGLADRSQMRESEPTSDSDTF